MKRFLFLLLTSFALIGCYETTSNDALNTFEYWAGTTPPVDIELLNGQYWESAHWTKEYIMYLKFKPTKVWWDEFLKQNLIPVDVDEWTKPDHAPNWFTPTHNTICYRVNGDMNQESRYFRDTLTGVCYFYEIQL